MKRVLIFVLGVVLVLGIGAGLVFGLGNGPKTYTVEITSNVDQIEYESKNNCRLGDNITIEAIPLDDYRFIGWEVNGVIVSEDVEYEITLTQENVNNVYKAVYKQEFTIYTGEVQNGNVASNVTKAIEGETITLTITPNDHYAFENAYYILYGETEHVAITNQTFTMPAGDVAIYATFTLQVSDEGMFETLTFTYNDTYKTASVKANPNNKPVGELVIPEKVLHNGSVYDVTSIYSANSNSNGAFYDCAELTSVILPSTIISIGNYAFFECGSLNNIFIPEGVESIGNSAFWKCTSLLTVKIPSTIQSIGDSAYFYCFALAEVYNNSNINIEPGSNENGYIGWYAEVVYSGNEINTESKVYNDKANGVAYYKESTTSYIALVCTDKTKTSITLDNNTTKIRQGAFQYCESLQDITIPNDLVEIENGAFQYCTSLQTINLGGSVGTMRNNAFANCTGLKRVVISDVSDWLEIVFENNNANPLNYAGHLFVGASEVTVLDIPEGTERINAMAFARCRGICKVVIPESVTEIGANAFRECFAIAEVYNHSSHITVDKDANNGYVAYYAEAVYSGATINMESKIIIDEIGGVAYYQESATSYIALVGINQTQTSLVLNEYTTKIRQCAFWGANISNITLNDGLKEIGIQAFRECVFESILIPESVETINNAVFSGCLSLSTVIIDSANIYNIATGTGSGQAGFLLNFATKVYVLSSVVEDTENNSNSFLNDTSKYTKSATTTTIGNDNTKTYYAYTKI